MANSKTSYGKTKQTKTKVSEREKDLDYIVEIVNLCSENT